MGWNSLGDAVRLGEEMRVCVLKLVMKIPEGHLPTVLDSFAPSTPAAPPFPHRPLDDFVASKVFKDFFHRGLKPESSGSRNRSA